MHCFSFDHVCKWFDSFHHLFAHLPFFFWLSMQTTKSLWKFLPCGQQNWLQRNNSPKRHQRGRLWRDKWPRRKGNYLRTLYSSREGRHGAEEAWTRCPWMVLGTGARFCAVRLAGNTFQLQNILYYFWNSLHFTLSKSSFINYIPLQKL